ncbi:unnamed protein product [Amoebophrya sp. A25]|nr:unnamed protein product [Amoebophrya sp. A25]|eukprot:GSA25T00016809001.1
MFVHDVHFAGVHCLGTCVCSCHLVLNTRWDAITKVYN